MVNGEKKNLNDLLRDLSRIGIKVEFEIHLDLHKVMGVTVVRNAKQGTYVVSGNGGKRFPHLYFEKYGFNITQMGNSHYIVPILK